MDRISIILLWLCINSNFVIQTEARTSHKVKPATRKFKQERKLTETTLDLLDSKKFAEGPFQLPPYEFNYGTGAPSSLPVDAPPFCVYPPFAPNPPSSPQTPIIYYEPPPLSPPEFVPGPPEYGPSPPESPVLPNPPEYVPSPPIFIPGPPINLPSPPAIEPGPPGYVPNPPQYIPGPPEYVPGPPEYVPGPPEYTPNPPQYVPSPPEYVSPPDYIPSPPEYVPGPPVYFPGPPDYIPGPPVFQPPVIYPPPAAPPPPYNAGQGFNMWCVAKPTVPDPIIQEAMNYACGSGADCGSIQPEGSCYQPDTLLSHASYAFNSYWQRTKAAGATCDFGGTATLITQDPSFDGCHYILF